MGLHAPGGQTGMHEPLPFLFEYYLLIMDLFRIAQKAGIYSFLRLKDYKNIFLKLLSTDSFKTAAGPLEGSFLFCAVRRKTADKKR